LQEYVIQQRIGVGGMGVVYKAVHSLINKEVAIKVLRSDVVTDPRDVDRMLDEARIINSIKNRNIINVFGAGTLSDGRHYLIMELLEGESLEQRMLRDGPVSPSDAVTILEEILSALAAAHAASIVHRDLKPANVFLVKESGKTYVKLLDFGLARRHQQNVTRIAGTPDYISPEHARGRPAGPPADLYAFGVMCFHMLTGRLPFVGNTPMEVMEKHVHQEPPVPHEINPAIPKALSELILKLLGKDPAQRPDAEHVKADLRAATKQLRNAATMMSLASIEAVGGKSRADEGDEHARQLNVRAELEDVKRQLKRKWPLLVGGFVGLWMVVVLAYVLWPSKPAVPSPVKLSGKKPVSLPTDMPTGTRPDVGSPRPGSKPVAPKPDTVKPDTVKPDTVKSGRSPSDTSPSDAVPVRAGSERPDVLVEFDAGPVVTGVFAEDNNRVLDDFAIGEFRRDKRDGQSIDGMLERMSTEIANNSDKEELFGKALKRVSELCATANTKRKLFDCDDELRKLHERFYKL
jgi:serine/threonine protein kinase